MKYIKINENIALAKSVLRKNNLSEKDEDYLKIREMVGTDYSYVGILTRLRYVDNVTDMDELKSIYDVLKNSKLDLGKLNKMSYEQILDTFYQLASTSNKDFELIYKDNTYSFFRVYTYQGILEIGSPAWCLKTKSHWDDYQSKYPEQWVAIENRYLKNIVTPNNNYFTDQYRNTNKAWVRFGVSIRHNDNGTITWLAHNDNDASVSGKVSSYTSFGVLATIINLSRGHKKSYYQKFCNNEYIRDGVFKITDDYTWERLGAKKPTNENDVNYLYFSKSYSYVPCILRLRVDSFPCIRTLNDKPNTNSNVEEGGTGFNALKDFVQDKRNTSYVGIRIKLGLTTKEKVRENPSLVTEVGQWFVFNWNDDYYIVVDSELKSINIPIINLKGDEFWNDEKGNISSFYFIDKSKMENAGVKIDTPESNEILRQLREKPKDKKDEEKPGFIKRFLGFK
jgi:hypothetical protein